MIVNVPSGLLFSMDEIFIPNTHFHFCFNSKYIDLAVPKHPDNERGIHGLVGGNILGTGKILTD